MKCDNEYCKTNSSNIILSCVWCNKKFHRQCVINNMNILFEQSNNIECGSCNPRLPLDVNEQGALKNKKLIIVKYGTCVSTQLELTKTEKDREYI